MTNYIVLVTSPCVRLSPQLVGEREPEGLLCCSSIFTVEIFRSIASRRRSRQPLVQPTGQPAREPRQYVQEQDRCSRASWRRRTAGGPLRKGRMPYPRGTRRRPPRAADLPARRPGGRSL